MSKWLRFLASATLLAPVLLVARPAAADQSVDAFPAVIVKMDDGHSIGELTALLPLTVESTVLASRGIYLVRSTDPKYLGKPEKTDDLAKKVEQTKIVVYAEPDFKTELVDTRFHAWPNGGAADAGTDPAVWSDQQAANTLRLVDAHRRSRGANTMVAVLDTGADTAHPALAGRVVPGWNYVDDDADPTESAADPGVAAGHGTFVSGVIAMVAPQATIVASRVLDSDGTGDVFVVAQAILDATAAGADVINLSFGTGRKVDSKVLDEALKEAQRSGAVVVAAAGNDADTKEHYPAARPEVLSVSALSSDQGQLATFSTCGGWVDVAAPGERVAGPVPGDRYAWWAGTSVAAPFVTGQVALLRAESPRARANDVVEAVTHTSDKLPKVKDRDIHNGAIDPVASLDFLARHH